MARKKSKYEFELNSREGTWVMVKPKPKRKSSLQDATGLIYLLVHDSRRMVKIGKTKVSAPGRRSSYVRTHKLSGKWRLAYEWSVTDVADIEKRIHAELKHLQFSGKAKEVFACSEDEACAVIHRHIKRP